MNLIHPKLAAALVLAVGLGAASAAQAASNVYFTVDIDPGVRYSQPVYVQPQPVYVAPQPQTYYYQPSPQYTQPATVYTRPYRLDHRDWHAQRALERAEWRRRQWERDHWRHDDDDDRRGHGYGHGYGRD